MNQQLSSRARLKQIITVLTRHRAIEALARQQHPEYVRLAFEELGPSFIKIGQLLSVRTDIVKPEFAQEFEKLQAQVKSADFVTIKPLIEEATGVSVEDLFAELEEEAFASASIAQVHRGRLLSGAPVVVKIQHPHIRETVLQDIHLLEKAVPLVKYIPAAKTTDPVEIVRELKRSLLQELDFNIEAEHTERFYENQLEVPYLRSPRVYREYSSETLLLLEYMEGVPIAQYLEGTRKGPERALFEARRSEIAQHLVDNYMKQVFEDGFFHADPHPSNIMLDIAAEHTRIVYLDFGMMGSMDELTAQRFNELLVALAGQKSERIAEALLQICKRRGPVDTDRLEDDVADIFRVYYGKALDQMDIPQIMRDILRLCKENGLVLPENLSLLFKGIVTLEGILERLDPQFSLMKAVQPYAEQYLKTRFGLKEELEHFGKTLLSLGKELPQIPLSLLTLLNKASAGKLRVSLEHKNLDGYLDRFERIVNRLSLSIVLAALILGFSWLVQASNETFSNVVSVVGIVGLGLVLLISLLVSLRGRNRRKR